MAREVILHTSQETFERLHTLADRRKAVISIPREELIQLLLDHSIMLAALTASTTFKVVQEQPTPHRTKPKLK